MEGMQIFDTESIDQQVHEKTNEINEKETEMGALIKQGEKEQKEELKKEPSKTNPVFWLLTAVAALALGVCLFMLFFG